MKIFVNALLLIEVAGILTAVFYVLLDYFFVDPNLAIISSAAIGSVLSFTTYRNYFREKQA